MTIEELRVAIEIYPQCLSKAMEEVTKAEQVIEKLEEQIDEEEARLSQEQEEDAPNEGMQDTTDTYETVLKLDHELALLELRYEQIKGEIELEYRRNPPPGDKVTEATVTAFVKSNSRLVEAKERCLEKKFERETANISRRVGYATERAESRKVVESVESMTSPKLERLREKLTTAEITLDIAQRKLEEVKVSILPYQLLVQLYTAGLVK